MRRVVSRDRAHATTHHTTIIINYNRDLLLFPFFAALFAVFFEGHHQFYSNFLIFHFPHCCWRLLFYFHLFGQVKKILNFEANKKQTVAINRIDWTRNTAQKNIYFSVE